VQQAIQLNFMSAPTTPESAWGNVWAISMRQGLGLIVVAALIAGFLPFLANTVTAISVGAPLPFVRLAQQAEEADGATVSQLGEGLQAVAGLAPSVFPPWFAALLSTVGEWINWPLRWLTWWLAYGAATLLAAKVWGAPTTLQRFFALTSYAAVPMILSGLGPIPCLGAVAQTLAIAWMSVVYGASVRAVTGLDWVRTVLAILLPAALLALLAFVFGLTIASTFVRMVF
jgi:hypothetical protein